MNSETPRPERLHWEEWANRCDLRRCEPATKEILAGFIARTLNGMLQDVRRKKPNWVENVHFDKSKDDVAWGYFEFEAQMKFGIPREGKDWKLSLLTGENVNEAVREACRYVALGMFGESRNRRTLDKSTISIEEPIYVGSGETVTLGQLLAPCDVEARAARDYASLNPESPAVQGLGPQLNKDASQLAHRAVQSMTLRSKVAFLAKHGGLPLDKPELLKIAGCGHESLNAAFQAANHLFKELARIEDGADSALGAAFRNRFIECVLCLLCDQQKSEKSIREVLGLIAKAQCNE